MITDLFIQLISYFIYLLSLILGSISTFIFPIGFASAITYFLGYFGFLQGVLDVNTLFICVGTYLTVLALIYTIKIALWVWGHMPWVGKHASLPAMTEKHEIVETRDSKGRSNVTWISRFK